MSVFNEPTSVFNEPTSVFRVLTSPLIELISLVCSSIALFKIFPWYALNGTLVLVDVKLFITSSFKTKSSIGCPSNGIGTVGTTPPVLS